MYHKFGPWYFALVHGIIVMLDGCKFCEQSEVEGVKYNVMTLHFLMQFNGAAAYVNITLDGCTYPD
jgi:hypothetical protein